LSKVYKNPQAQAWGYTDKARLRGLRKKTTFHNRIWYKKAEVASGKYPSEF
jgi:hypothetical protein